MPGQITATVRVKKGLYNKALIVLMYMADYFYDVELFDALSKRIQCEYKTGDKWLPVKR